MEQKTELYGRNRDELTERQLNEVTGGVFRHIRSYAVTSKASDTNTQLWVVTAT